MKRESVKWNEATCEVYTKASGLGEPRGCQDEIGRIG